MHPLLRAAAERQLGLMTAVDARRAGYQHAEIRRLCSSGRWIRLRRGIYIEAATLAAAEPGARQRIDCLALLLALDRSSTVLSHGTAARLWALPVRFDLEHTLRVTDPTLWRRGRDYLMTQATISAEDATFLEPLRLTTVPRTLVDCAREWTLEDAVVAMDAALLAKATTPAQLRAAADSAHHRPGAPRAVRAVTLADGRAESPLETRGRLRILGAGLPVPQLQVEIRAEGRLVAVVDAWFDGPAVAVEFDGKVKYTDPWRTPGEVLWQEKRREDAVRALGIRVVRLAEADVHRNWPASEKYLRMLLGQRGPALRAFTTVARERGVRRVG